MIFFVILKPLTIGSMLVPMAMPVVTPSSLMAALAAGAKGPAAGVKMIGHP